MKQENQTEKEDIDDDIREETIAFIFSSDYEEGTLD